MKTYKTARYEPQPEIEIARTLGVVGAGAVVGIACGIAGALFTTYLFSFPIVFNAVIGVAIALVMVKINELSKVRVPALMAVGAIVAGLFAIGTLHYGDYLSFKSSFNDVPTEDVEYALALKACDRGEVELPRALLDSRPTKAEEVKYIEMLQVASFVEYLNTTAQHGIELGRPGRSGGVNLGFGGTIAYWAVEGIILIGIAMLIVWKESNRPFCESCDRWMDATTIGEIFADSKRIASLIDEGNLSMLEYTQPGADKTRLKLHRCEGCGSADESVVRVVKVTYHEGQEDESRIADFTMSDEAVVALMTSLERGEHSEETQVLESVRDISEDVTAVAGDLNSSEAPKSIS